MVEVKGFRIFLGFRILFIIPQSQYKITMVNINEIQNT